MTWPFGRYTRHLEGELERMAALHEARLREKDGVIAELREDRRQLLEENERLRMALMPLSTPLGAAHAQAAARVRKLRAEKTAAVVPESWETYKQQWIQEQEAIDKEERDGVQGEGRQGVYERSDDAAARAADGRAEGRGAAAPAAEGKGARRTGKR